MDPTELELLIPRSSCQGSRFTPEFTSSLAQGAGGGGRELLSQCIVLLGLAGFHLHQSQLHLILKKVADAVAW